MNNSVHPEIHPEIKICIYPANKVQGQYKAPIIADVCLLESGAKMCACYDESACLYYASIGTHSK